MPGIVTAAPYVELEAMLANGGELAGVVIEGIDPARDAAFADQRAAIFGAGLAELRPGILSCAARARACDAPGACDR